MAKPKIVSTPVPKSSTEVMQKAEFVGPWRVGTAYLIRTVTYFILGRLTEIYELELVLEEASWVADTGRFHEALRTGKLAEVEPFVSAVIGGRDAICDSTEWTHALPIKVV
jgi:hypothetical protein